jgi:hypothetical protein
MGDFTHNWLWPQWAILFFLAMRFSISASKHGQEKLETTGERKGLPERYNGFMAIGNIVIWIAVLICGGFF